MFAKYYIIDQDYIFTLFNTRFNACFNEPIRMTSLGCKENGGAWAGSSFAC